MQRLKPVLSDLGINNILGKKDTNFDFGIGEFDGTIFGIFWLLFVMFY